MFDRTKDMNKNKDEKRNGYALLIGVNEVSEAHYQGWRGFLRSCEADARAMSALLKGLGYRGASQEVPPVLTSCMASRMGVQDAIKTMARVMSNQDTGMIFFSGHGGKVPDLDRDEKSGTMDQTWCLQDGMLIDDEIAALLTEFPPNSRVIVVSDSCYSGDITKHRPLNSNDDPIAARTSKFMDIRRSILVYQANRDDYVRRAKAAAVTLQRNHVGARVAMLSACQTSGTTNAGSALSDFTRSLLTACQDSSVDTYDELTLRVRAQLPSQQRPVFKFGPMFVQAPVSSRPFAF